MGIRPTVGSGQSAMASMSATMRYIIFWSVMMGLTGGQELLTPRNHDNLNVAEIRFDPRALSWMEFTKPEPSSSHTLQQKHQQWLQPPMPVNANNPRRTPEQQWNPHGQHWPGHFDHSQQHHPLLTNHPDRKAAHQQPYRSVQTADEMHRRPKQQQVPPPARDVPSGSISSEQWHREIAQPQREPTYHPGAASASSTETSDILSDVRSDEILEEEFYDSSELFEEDETELDSTGGEHSALAKSKAEEEMLTRQKDEEDATMEILSAFTSGLSNVPRRNEESGSDKEQVNAKTPPASIQQTPTWKQLYPQLLGPATPPGKRVIVTEEHPLSKPKAIDNHRVSYGLTAASVYARIQPSLRPRNGTGGLRQRVVPRPYKRRPITVKSTTTVPVDKQQEPHVQDVEEGEEEEDDFDLITEEIETENNEPAIEEIDEMEEPKEMAKETQQENEPKIEAQSEPPDQLSSKEDIQVNIAANHTEAIGEEEEPMNEKSEPAIQLKNPISTMENETLKSKPSSPAAASGPADIKSLLRSAGPLSLSEILQQKGMSLTDLLKGGTQIAPVIGVTTSSPIASNAASPKNHVKVEHDTTSTATPITSTHSTTAKTMVTNAPIRPGVLPSVKPISFRELLAAKNVTFQEIIHPDMTVIGTEKPSTAVGGTLKPGVKLPIPFAPGRGKGLAGLVASTPAPSEEHPAESMNSKSTTTPQPSKPMNSKSVSELKPLIFGGGRPLDEDSDATTTTSTTTTRTTSRQMVIHSKRPYVAGMNVGEYGSHLGRSFEEDEDEEDGSNTRSKSSNNLVGSYGMQRPIATSRLTPAPPRKQRPVLNFNYNALSEEEDEDDTGTTTTPSPILTHFNEDELIENDPYFDLPVSVRNAIIVSSTIGGFCLVVFLVILLVFRIRQKTRIRLRHPAALLGLGGMTDMTASNGSDSSGITTPTSHAASKSGYAKLPRRSSSLWGTLRRSVRQMEVHYS